MHALNSRTGTLTKAVFCTVEATSRLTCRSLTRRDAKRPISGGSSHVLHTPSIFYLTTTGSDILLAAAHTGRQVATGSDNRSLSDKVMGLYMPAYSATETQRQGYPCILSTNSRKHIGRGNDAPARHMARGRLKFQRPLSAREQQPASIDRKLGASQSARYCYYVTTRFEVTRGDCVHLTFSKTTI